MANTPFFWNRIAKNYIASPVGNEAAYQHKLKLTQDVLQPDWNLLEIACGSGNTALTHAPFVNHVLATDFSENMMKHGQARARDEGIENVDFKQVSIWDIPETPTYDAVLTLSFLHLIPEWKAAVKKIATLVAPGGIYASNTVTMGDSTWLNRTVGRIVNLLPIMPSLRVLSKDEVIAELEANGFIIEHVYEPDGGTSLFVIARKPV